MKNLKEILKKVRDILYLFEDKLLILVPEKQRKLVRDIINVLILAIGAALAVIATL